MERVHNVHTLHDHQRTDVAEHRCEGRVVECDGSERDTLECYVCGRQWTAACTFDDEQN